MEGADGRKMEGVRVVEREKVKREKGVKKRLNED